MHETASHFQINEFVRTAAQQMHGDARFLHAPSLVSEELRSVLARDPDTARIPKYWRRADTAILGIGDFQRASSDHAVAFDSEHASAVVGDVVRHYFDDNGREVRWRGQENLMAISREQLRRIPLSIGVATGREKVRAVLGAARSGMVNALVIERLVARLMLEHLEGASDTAGGDP
jgi:DNA-binding transcriptional regulator LsrR (DeoR family)